MPMITAIVLIDADPGRIPEIAAQVAEGPGVSEVYSVTPGTSAPCAALSGMRPGSASIRTMAVIMGMPFGRCEVLHHAALWLRSSGVCLLYTSDAADEE